MKYCPACNSEYADKYHFCRLDGTALADNDKEVSEPAQTEIREEAPLTEAKPDASQDDLQESPSPYSRNEGQIKTEQSSYPKPVGGQRFELLSQ